ncbi:MAG TPA: hypothetical protein ENG29_00255 [Firmicutes bacterium]|uniref:Uncharacterized protein n=1 Tax=Candidatus Coatesbacteria bacterium 4484_99 TaxID=1970774 RepID=A0A1W9S2I5_9BACT|nr:MAG: hypothetical protein B6D57_01085 [Candidatus Coatesbacteria bacterium 4484_99]RLC41804.1 MAG: hypothetical protein DRH51_02295 [Candidatus Coatesbacteria bacterium]HDM42801.1 hypothetical protein [Bacillota bacterium]RLC42829.1 MAG: hypothetical protein DRH49_03015 [Candidatus Coatesbacteria bacterium]RLC44364.1 MAG: hypothetical protein DRH44_02585 [Candidatus Coatesbacteria bacterium]
MKPEELDLEKWNTIDIASIPLDELIEKYPSIYHLVIDASVWARELYKITSIREEEDELFSVPPPYVKTTKIGLGILEKRAREEGGDK